MAKDKKSKSAQSMTEVKSKSSEGKKSQPSESAGSSGIWQDERFEHLFTDPRFRNMPKKHRKVKIDKRFEGMFTDDKFKVKYTVDKYGRRINKSNADDLRKFYELDDQDDDFEDDESKQQEDKKPKQADYIVKDPESDTDEEVKERRAEELAISQLADVDDLGNNALESDAKEVPMTIRERLLDPHNDYARGEGHLLSDSSSDDSSTDDEDGDHMLKIDHVWGELHCDAEETEESTRRLAVCNMDWDRIRALDIMVLLSSFLPPGGSVLSVKIYPSEFGKERMAEEEVHGPTELVGMGKSKTGQKSADDDNDGVADDDSEADSSGDEEELVQEQDSDAEEGDDYHMEKLRQYQLNRLRYYYAVVECDSVATADKLYKECDGIEYESSATRVDLRFIPDDTSFEDDELADVCTELPDVNSYKPRQFTTTALQQAKVDLTWDETALERRELGDKLSSCKLDQISDKDLRQIVAYSSSEEEEEGVVVEHKVKPEAEEKSQEIAEKVKSQKLDKAAATTMTKESKKKNKQKADIEKYKALLAAINEKEQMSKKKKYEMEFSWNVNESKQKEAESDEDAVAKSKQQLTPIEKVLQNRSKKNKKRKEERRRKKLEAQGIDPENSDDDSIPDGIDMNDSYFAEEFADGDFIEPKKSNKNAKSKKKSTKNTNDDFDAEEKERKAKELELLLDDDDVDASGKQHFSLEKILKTEQESSSAKRKRRKQLKKSKAEQHQKIEDNFQINVTDPRFSAVYLSHVYNIDPTDSHFKKTKGMEQIINEKLKRRQLQCESAQKPVVNGSETTMDGETTHKRAKKQLENSLLVKSLKRKIKQIDF